MAKMADVCLILEGSYPYVRGGVSGWTHELIESQPHLNFALVALIPRDDEDPKMRYELPDNVTSFDTVRIQHLPEGTVLPLAKSQRLLGGLNETLRAITAGAAGIKEYQHLLDQFGPYRTDLGTASLLDSEGAFELLSEMYERDFSESSFLDYFWSWRALLAGLFSLSRCELPKAKSYHAVSTGYAGLLAARAKVETGKPVILTEHGIYTNERRIEIATAGWLAETSSDAMTIDELRMDLRDFWTAAFANYSRIAYEAADEVVTLYTGNQNAQIADGAPVEKLSIIPNGIDVEKFAANPKALNPESPVVALIGRVVPVKDIKCFIRAVANLKVRLPHIQAKIIGPREEDESYVTDCQLLIDYLGIESHIEFTGRLDVAEALPQIDLVVLSSISEAQPLTLLEAGASGTPVVSTDVGACREIIFGSPQEEPPLGEGGLLVPAAHPLALADAMQTLLTDEARYTKCAGVLKKRVETYYHKSDQHAAYRTLYENYLDKEQR